MRLLCVLPDFGILQLKKDLLDNIMCAMQADKGKQGSWFHQVPQASSKVM